MIAIIILLKSTVVDKTYEKKRINSGYRTINIVKKTLI